MDGRKYIIERQRQWAWRKDFKLCGSSPPRGDHLYTVAAEDNLFRSLSEKTTQQFIKGDGGELRRTQCRPCKMQALHSSAALAVNVFEYWSQLGDACPVLKALKIPKRSGPTIHFEQRFPITHSFDGQPNYKHPNIDVVLRSKEQVIAAIECKFTEAYTNHSTDGRLNRYLKLLKIWDELPGLRRLAEELSVNAKQYPLLNPAQLIKHILGLRKANGPKKFRLVYLWYDVPGRDGTDHRDQVDRFTKIAKGDGISFQGITYQELILSLCREVRNEHKAYVDYLSERYL